MTVSMIGTNSYCDCGTEGRILANTRQNTRAIDRMDILKSEWTVLVGESLVAVGSLVVVIGLLRAFRALLKEY